MKTMTPALSSAGLLSLIFHLLASVEISYAFTISTQKISSQPFFYKKSSSGSSRLEYRVLQPLALSKQDEDDEMRIEDQSASSLTDKTSTNGETETNGAKILNDSSPELQEMKQQKQVQTKTKKPTAVATSLKDNDGDDVKNREIEIQEKLDEQKQELESKFNVELARLKLTLATTREELDQVEGRAKAFEETSKSLQKELALEIQDKSDQLVRLKKEVNEKYKAQVDAIKADQIAQAEKMEDEVANLESTIEELKDNLRNAGMKAAELEETTEMLEKRIATEIEAKRTALLELERSLTEKFEEKADVLKEENEKMAKELEKFKKESEELLLEIQTESKSQKEAMESQVGKLTNSLEIVIGKLKDARKTQVVLKKELEEKTVALETQTKLNEQKEEIEARYNVELARLKLTLATTREELDQTEGRAKAFEETSKSLQKDLALEIKDKSDKLERLEKELDEKFIAQVDAIKADQIAQAEKMEDEVANLESTIEELRSDLNVAETKAAELEETTEMLEKRIATEIEAKRTALLELERSLTEKFEEELDALKQWGNQKAEELEQFKKESEELILQIKTENQAQKEAMEKRINNLTDELGIVTRKLKNARKYHGTLRKDLNQTRQRALIDLKQALAKYKEEKDIIESNFTSQVDTLKETYRLEQEILVKDRDDILTQLEVENDLNKQLKQEIEELKEDFKMQLKEQQIKAEKDLKEISSISLQRLRITIARSDKKRQEITKERNQAVAERDAIIKEYEKELSSVKRMSRRSLELINVRSRKRYDTFEAKYEVVKKTRLAFVKPLKKLFNSRSKKS